MKKSISLVSLSILLASCSTAMPPQLGMQPNLQPNALRSFSLEGEQTLDESKEDTPTLKAVQSELANKEIRGGSAKPIGHTPVRLQPPTRSRNPRSIASTASFALESMNRARTWESGYNIGVQALKNMSSEAYIARLGLAASSPAMKWETAYYVVAYSLEHIASGRENTIPATCNIISNMMDKSKTWEEGSRIGFASLKFIRQTATPNLRSFIDTAISSADAARYWEDTYKTLDSAFRRMRTMQP